LWLYYYQGGKQAAMSDVSRRSFFRRTLALSALVFGGLPFSVPPAFAAIEVTAALAVINTALALGRLFSSSGSVGDLLKLQTQMLQTISAQIAVVQRGIDEILTRLGEIQAMIGQLPAEVVNELYRRRLNALLGTYTEIMSAYQADVARRGVATAHRQNADELENELLKPLREVRSVLLTTPAYVNVPLLSAALHTEVHAMIMCGYRTVRIKPALDRYREWFTTTLRTDSASIESRIATLREQRRALSAEIPTLAGRHACVIEGRMIPPYVANPCTPEGGTFVGLRAKIGSYGYSSSLSPLGDLASSIQALLDRQALVAADLPAILVAVPNGFEQTVTVSGCAPRLFSSHPDLIPATQEQVANYITNVSKCANADRAATIVQRAREVSTAMTDTAYPLITFAALKVNCEDALVAIDRFAANLQELG
jgi:hypothetical protein